MEEKIVLDEVTFFAISIPLRLKKKLDFKHNTEDLQFNFGGNYFKESSKIL